MTAHVKLSVRHKERKDAIFCSALSTFISRPGGDIVLVTRGSFGVREGVGRVGSIEGRNYRMDNSMYYK